MLAIFLSERLGHSAIRLTADAYSHVLESMQQETARSSKGCCTALTTMCPSLALLQAFLVNTPPQVSGRFHSPEFDLLSRMFYLYRLVFRPAFDRHIDLLHRHRHLWDHARHPHID